MRLQQLVDSEQPPELVDGALVLAGDDVEETAHVLGDQAIDVTGGDLEIGLERRHLDVGQERGEEVPLGHHLLQRFAEPGGARRRQTRPDTEPAGDDLAGLRPAEHPGDGP